MDTLAELQRKFTNLIRLGTVAEVDHARARCRVQSGDILTALLPWLAPRAGLTRDWSAPSPGEQVLLLCPLGDTTQALVLRGVYSQANPAPADDGARHVTQYPDGAVVEYDHAAHALIATLPTGGTAELVATGGITLTGDVRIHGNVAVAGRIDATGDVVGDGISLTTHKHGGVAAGTATTGAPG